MKYKNIILYLATTVMVISCGSVAHAQKQALSISKSTDCLSHTKLDSVSTNTKSLIKNTSSKAEMGLALHLKRIKAKMYGAFWCPYCARQKELFGKDAFARIKYIECDPRGQNPRPNLCQKARITGYPTWEINGRMYSGMISLDSLANISGYKGSRNFKN